MPGCVGEGFGEENEEAQLSTAGRSREPVLCAHPLPLPGTKPPLSPCCHRRMVTAVLPCLSPGGGTAGLPCVTRGHLCHFPLVLPQGTETPRGSRAQLSLAPSSPAGSPWPRVPQLGGRELLGRAGFGVLRWERTARGSLGWAELGGVRSAVRGVWQRGRCRVAPGTATLPGPSSSPCLRAAVCLSSHILKVSPSQPARQKLGAAGLPEFRCSASLPQPPASVSPSRPIAAGQTRPYACGVPLLPRQQPPGWDF